MESDKNSVYRMCIITMPMVFEIVDYESAWAGGQIHDEFAKTKGAISYLMGTAISDASKSLRANFSLNIENEFGTRKKDGTLTGCYRKIRDNESDISLALHDFPTVDYEKVDPYQVFGEVSLKILSVYHSKTEAEVSFNDFVLTSIKSFDKQTWFTVLVMVLAFFGLWMAKRALSPDNEDVSLKRTVFETLWDTLLLFLSQESRDYYNIMDRLLSILMTLSFFFLTTIYFGLMSTDLVSVTKPSVINSYQDIMNRPNITPIFSAVNSETQEFEDAYEDDNGSILAKFWAKYKDKAEMVHSNIDPAKLTDMMQEIAALNRVIIMNELAIDSLRRSMCKFKAASQVFPNLYSWVARDLNSKTRQKVLIMRNGMTQTPQLKAFRRKIRSISETGIVQGIIQIVTWNGVESLGQASILEGPHSEIQRCVSDQVVYADASVDTVVLQNYYLLLAVTVVMLPASIIILLLELYCHRNLQVAI